MNPGDFARQSLEGPGPGAGEGGPSPPRGAGSLFDALLSTTGGAPLSQIQAEYGCDKPTALVLRGCMKLGEFDGFPAVLDILAGSMLMLIQATGGETGGAASAIDQMGEVPHEP